MWRLFAAIAATCVALLLWPEALGCLRWQHGAVDAGQPWRVLSAHFVHMSLLHALANLAGLALVIELLGASVRPAEAVVILLASALAIIGALALFNPTIQWYAGLSGAVHGLWAGFALMSVRGHRLRPRAPTPGPALPWAALGTLALKLSGMLMPWPTLASGLPLVPESHLYGAIGGAGAALVLMACESRQAMRMESGLK
jgi:rhomboid family GlyGly-CTERM serine protease